MPSKTLITRKKQKEQKAEQKKQAQLEQLANQFAGLTQEATKLWSAESNFTTEQTLALFRKILAKNEQAINILYNNQSTLKAEELKLKPNKALNNLYKMQKKIDYAEAILCQQKNPNGKNNTTGSDEELLGVVSSVAALEQHIRSIVGIDNEAD